MCDARPVNIPPSSYGNIPLSIESDDPLYNVGKRELALALRTPADYPWVADWLFKNSDSPFHSTPSALPPEAFENALGLHLHHDIFTPGPGDFSCSGGDGDGRTPSNDNTQSRPPPPSQQQQPNQNPSFSKFMSSARVVVSKDIDFLVVPVARIDQVTVGYAFLTGMDDSGTKNPLQAGLSPLSPFPKQSSSSSTSSQQQQTPAASNPVLLHARFCFHHSRNEFCTVVTGEPSVPFMGILSMRHLSDTARDRSFFVIPRAEYGADKLPKRVLSMQSNIDYVVPVPDETEGLGENLFQTNNHSNPDRPGEGNHTTAPAPAAVPATDNTTNIADGGTTTTVPATDNASAGVNGDLSPGMVNPSGFLNGSAHQQQYQNQNGIPFGLNLPNNNNDNINNNGHQTNGYIVTGVEKVIGDGSTTLADWTDSRSDELVGSVTVEEVDGGGGGGGGLNGIGADALTTPSISDAMLPDVVHDYMLNYIDTDLLDQVLSEEVGRIPRNVPLERLEDIFSARVDEGNVNGTGTGADDTEFMIVEDELDKEREQDQQQGQNGMNNVHGETIIEPLMNDSSSDDLLNLNLNPNKSPTSSWSSTAASGDSFHPRPNSYPQPSRDQQPTHKRRKNNHSDTWLVDGDGTLPDGVGMARTAGRQQTSSGAFDLSGLADALRSIDKSVRGTFFGPKVHKDIMHPQTGELVSRCTGEVSAKMKRVDGHTWHVMKRTAVQSYYTNLLPVVVDPHFLSSPNNSLSLSLLQRQSLNNSHPHSRSHSISLLPHHSHPHTQLHQQQQLQQQQRQLEQLPISPPSSLPQTTHNHLLTSEQLVQFLNNQIPQPQSPFLTLADTSLHQQRHQQQLLPPSLHPAPHSSTAPTTTATALPPAPAALATLLTAAMPPPPPPTAGISPPNSATTAPATAAVATPAATTASTPAPIPRTSHPRSIPSPPTSAVPVSSANGIPSPTAPRPVPNSVAMTMSMPMPTSSAPPTAAATVAAAPRPGQQPIAPHPASMPVSVPVPVPIPIPVPVSLPLPPQPQSQPQHTTAAAAAAHLKRLAPRPAPVILAPAPTPVPLAPPPRHMTNGVNALMAAAAAATAEATAKVASTSPSAIPLATVPTAKSPNGEAKTVDEEAAKLSKLEAKRIKNRLSAARSNHKRRLQLEAKKKELALLRKRAEELKSKKQLVTAENESLKKQLAQGDVSLG